MIRLNDSGIFKLFMLGVGLLGFILATTYNTTAGMIPLVLSALLIILTTFMFLQENVPALSKFLGFINQKGLFSEEKSSAGSPENSRDDKQEYRKLLRLLIWLIAFAVVLGFVTYFVAVPLFLLLFIRFEGSQSWRNAIITSAGMGIFMVVLLDVLLKSTF